MNLFALLEHEDSANYLDLIVAADWAFRSKVPSKRYLTEVLAEELDLDERMVIGRMYIFDPGGKEWMRPPVSRMSSTGSWRSGTRTSTGPTSGAAISSPDTGQQTTAQT